MRLEKSAQSRAPQLGDRPQNFSAIAENNAGVFQILIGQVAKHREINAVLREALPVLGHAEAVEPARNLPHRCGARGLRGV